MVDQARFTIAVGARTDRSVRTALTTVNTQLTDIEKSSRRQNLTLKQLRTEFKNYGTTGVSGTRNLNREINTLEMGYNRTRARVGELRVEQRRLNTELRATERNAGLVTRSLRTLGRVGAGRLAAAGGIAGAGLLLRSGAQQARTIQRQSALTGLDAQQTQTTLDFFTAVNIENPESALTQLNLFQRRIGEAIQRPGGREADSFRQLGVNVQALSQLNAPEQLLQISQALSQVENRSIRASLASDVLGRGFQIFTPIIAQAGRASTRLEEIRTTWTNTSNAAVQANDMMGEAFQRSGNELSNLRQELSAAFAPAVTATLNDAINPMLAGLVKWTSENQTAAGVIGVTTVVVAAGSGKIAMWGEQIFFATQGAQTLAKGVRAARTALAGQTLVTIASSAAQGIATGVTTLLSAATTGLGVAIRFALGPIGLILIGIGLLVAVGIYAYRNWDTIRARLTIAFAAIGDAGASVVNFLIGGWNRLVSVALLIPRSYLKIAEVVTGIIRRITFGKVDIDLSPIRRGIDELEQAAQIDVRLRTDRRSDARVRAAVQEIEESRQPTQVVEPETTQPSQPTQVVQPETPQPAAVERRGFFGGRGQSTTVETAAVNPPDNQSQNRGQANGLPLREGRNVRSTLQTEPEQRGARPADASTITTVMGGITPELRDGINRLIKAMNMLERVERVRALQPQQPQQRTGPVTVTITQEIIIQNPNATAEDITEAISENTDEIVEAVREAIG